MALALAPASQAMPRSVTTARDYWLYQEIEHYLARAEREAPAVIAGRCRVAGHEGELAWAVSSSSRPGRWHLVWLSGGRLCCGCEHTKHGARFCLHRAAVRLALVAGRGVPASPSSVVDHGPETEHDSTLEPIAEPQPEPEHDPEPEPPTPSAPFCPSCGLPADPDELRELGECLVCLAGRTGERHLIPRCVRCGKRAYAESAAGPLCSECIAARSAANATARRAIDAERAPVVSAAEADNAARESYERASERAAAAAIIASEKQRQARYRKQGRAGDVRRTLRAQDRAEEREEARRRSPGGAKEHETAPLYRKPAAISPFK